MVLLKAPIEPRNASRSPMRERVASSEFYCDEIELRARSSNLSMSPDRGRGKTPLSRRTTGVSRSPACSSTGGSVNGDVPKSPLSDTGENSSGGRKSTWRDRVKPLLSDEHKMYGEGRFKSPYVDPKHSFENGNKPANVQELQKQRDELLRKFNELNDQLSGLEATEVSSPGHEPIQRFTPDRNMERPSDFKIGSEASSSTKGHNFDSSLADNNLGFGHSRFSVEGRISNAASVPSSKPNSDAGGHAFSKDSTLNPRIADNNLGFVPSPTRISVDDRISDEGVFGG